MEPAILKEFIDLHRTEIIRRWSDHWNYIQSQRSQSSFPDPPYNLILDQLPYRHSRSAPIPDEITKWFKESPVFCSGAAFCQLHVSVAFLLTRKKYHAHESILHELEASLESIILDAGTKKWLNTILGDPREHESVQAERLAVIGQLAAGIAHEIGNPLTSIDSIAQLLLRRSENGIFTDRLVQIRKGIERISKIVRELTEFSRPASPTPTEVDLDEILASAINLVQYDKRAEGIAFESSSEESVPHIHIVPDQLLQVLVNLLLNAVDAMNGVGVISTRIGSEKNTVSISVRDSGSGIPDSVRPRIFDPFFTTKPMGKGTGLGLSVSYGIVTNYSGSILVDSQPGEGSTFTVVLPREYSPVSKSRQQRQRVAPSPPD